MSYKIDRTGRGEHTENPVAHPVGLVPFLRAQHPQGTVNWVASVSGVSPSTVEKWLSGVSIPSLPVFLVLVAHYGPPLIAAVFKNAPSWLDDASRVAQLDEIEAKHVAHSEALMRELAELRRGRGSP